MKELKKYLIISGQFDIYDKIGVPIESVIEIQANTGSSKPFIKTYGSHPVTIDTTFGLKGSYFLVIKGQNNQIIALPFEKSIGIYSVQSLSTIKDNFFQSMAHFANNLSVPIFNLNVTKRLKSISSKAFPTGEKKLVLGVFEHKRTVEVIKFALKDHGFSVGIFPNTLELLNQLENIFEETKLSGVGIEHQVSLIILDSNLKTHEHVEKQLKKDPRFTGLTLAFITPTEEIDVQIAHIIEKHLSKHSHFDQPSN